MATELLIVEDEPIVNNYLTEKLQDIGYTVHSAFNGKDGLKIAKRANVNLIVTDIVMPEMDGVHFCQELRKIEKLAGVPVICSTAWANREDELRGSGVKHFIVKPYDIRDLKDMIENILNPPQRLTEPRKITAVGEMVITVKKVVEELQRDNWPINFKFLEVTGNADSLLRDLAAVKSDLVIIDRDISSLNINALVDRVIDEFPQTPLVLFNENRFNAQHHVDNLDDQTRRGRIIHLEKLTKMNLALVIVKLLKK